MIRLPLLAAVALLASVPMPTTAAPNDPLRIVQFDFEGGGGTLFVTPNGKTLMIDTAWPAGRGGPAPLPGGQPIAPTKSSAQRIVEAVKAAGATRIDYLLMTHYHLDHIGGFDELVKLIPVGTFLDHGDNREMSPANATPAQRAAGPAAAYARYVTATASGKRVIMKPGDRVVIDGVTVTATNADRAVPSRPLAGAGRPGVGCGTRPVQMTNGGEENPRSLGFVASFGRARIMLLGDTTRDVEYDLVCPRDLIGPIDLMLATHHGSDLSNGTVVPATVKARVVVIANGQTKGGDPSSYEAISAATPADAIWQVHEAVKPGARNTQAARIANPAGVADANHPILIAVARNGAITVTNPRTGESKTYAKK
jgi:beta-lactamase superfamily II metal-dependent hydrolase